jgi:hypothetical protein
VAGAGDADCGFVPTAIDRASIENLEQLGVQRPSIELEHQLGDFWSDGKHGTDSFNFSSATDAGASALSLGPD